MPMFSERFGWRPIDTAPVCPDVSLMVTDGGKPYLLNGDPVEVETTVNVVFNLGG